MDRLTQYAALAGIRIQIIAQSLGCKTAFARSLHDRLSSGAPRPEVWVPICSISNGADPAFSSASLPLTISPT